MPPAPECRPRRAVLRRCVRPVLLAFAVLTMLSLGAQPGARADDGQVAALSAPDLGNRSRSGATGTTALAEADIARYRAIFRLQEAAEWPAADREIAALQDRRLMGHVLAQRYLHPTGWTASYAALRDWLAAYGDHPMASRIHALAERRRPYGSAPPPTPRVSGGGDRPWRPVLRFGLPLCESARLDRDARSLQRQVRRALYDDRPGAALRQLAAAGVTATVHDRLLGDIATHYYTHGTPLAALDHAVGATERTGGRAEAALWIAGLAHWQLGDYPQAGSYFGRLAQAECASAWERSAGSYWAARVALRTRDFDRVSDWLQRAAAHRYTFYGLMARRALGIDSQLRLAPPRLGEGHLVQLGTTPAGRRALALAQVGRGDLAEAELMVLRPEPGNRLLVEAMLALADRHGMARLAAELGVAHQPGPSAYYESALYPVTAWAPAGGWRVDRALIHAIAREESLFDPDAVSYAGAAGLMQLMPGTARAMAAEIAVPLDRERLFDPETNLALGQAYIETLFAFEPVGRDLVRVLVSYNAGPGNLLDWVESVDHRGDPLLFIESLPSGQARAYVEHVLASLWIYRQRMNQAAPSLDALVAGQWPRYLPQDGLPPMQVAEHAEFR